MELTGQVWSERGIRRTCQGRIIASLVRQEEEREWRAWLRSVYVPSERPVVMEVELTRRMSEKAGEAAQWVAAKPCHLSWV